MFKPVTSTTYARLVWTFYKHLTYDCNRLDVLSSTIDNVDIEVTTTDIVAALKCHAEFPQSEKQGVACPSTLTTEKIIDDMCERRYTDQDQVPLARPSCLHNSGLWILCYNGMCATWDIKHRDMISSSLPFMLSIKAIGAPFLASFGDTCINSRNGCIYELLRVPKPRDYPSHSSSPTYSRRKALEAPRQMGPSLITHNLA